MRKLGLLLMLISGTLFAQDKCSTMLQDSINRIKYPSMGSMEMFEDQLQRMINERTIRAQSGRIENEILTLPVMVHVVHNGEPDGSGTNISYEQVLSQLEVLNEDFRRKEGTPGFNDHPDGADIEMEFCLSPVDENGVELDEPGVMRHNGGRATWTQAEIENTLKPSTVVNPDLFFNVWVLNFDPSFTVVGYAQFPEGSGLSGLPPTGSRNTDGVVIAYYAFGSSDKGDFSQLRDPYDKGRTLSHEVGHWLGLRHIWGDGPCSVDDFCADTPEQQAPSNGGCPVGQQSCGSFDMVENYMDYSSDACQNIFTQDQKARMLAVMELSPRRNTLATASVCSRGTEEPPVARFSSDPDSTLRGGTVKFSDLSTNFPDQWIWTFEGGNPNTSTEKNPQVIYTNAGFFDVELIAINEFGSDTVLIEDYMKVLDEGVCNSLSNFEDGYTKKTLSADAVGDYKGYLAGHSELGYEGISEFFDNPFKYEFISGVNIDFGYAHSIDEDATVNVNVWNARGVQGAPGAIIEQKKVPMKQILEDVQNGRTTEIIFDRETPVFNAPFHVGIELDYKSGDTVALVTSELGEGDKLSVWKKDLGKWGQYGIDLGVNMATTIEPIVGMINSVQVSASNQVVNSGSQVSLQARGGDAGIFVWNSDDGEVQDFIGPQLIVNPRRTTIYSVEGSGEDLCDSIASITIYVKEITGTPKPLEANLKLYPNPMDDLLSVEIAGMDNQPTTVSIYNTSGALMQMVDLEETSNDGLVQVNVRDYPSGIYLVQVTSGSRSTSMKVIKR